MIGLIILIGMYLYWSFSSIKDVYFVVKNNGDWYNDLELNTFLWFISFVSILLFVSSGEFNEYFKI